MSGAWGGGGRSAQMVATPTRKHILILAIRLEKKLLRLLQELVQPAYGSFEGPSVELRRLVLQITYSTFCT